MPKQKKILAIIPARGDSSGIPNKNILSFVNKPLISHTIEQAQLLMKDKQIDRIFIATDSPDIATIATATNKVKVPWLLPKNLTKPNSPVYGSIVYIINKLKQKENYSPDYIIILQTITPLRNKEDIKKCIKETKNKSVEAVVTVCQTHPLLINLTKDRKFSFANPSSFKTTNRQSMSKSFKLNGFVYIIKPKTLIKEKTFFPKNTKVVICDAWRSIDLDEPEDWALAEVVYKNKDKIKKEIKRLTQN